MTGKEPPMETPASIKELKRADKKRFYRLLEVEYVEGPEISLRKLAKRYNISLQGLYKYAKRHKWREKRAEFTTAMEAKGVDQTSAESFQGFAESQHLGMAWRANEYLNRRRKEVENEGRLDTVDDIIKDNGMLQSLTNLGIIIHGPPKPVEPPDTIFEAVIVEQKVSYRQISRIPPEPEPIEVRIPEGLSISDVTGRPQEET